MTGDWSYDEVETRQAFPWPPEEDSSALGAFAETWKSASLEPGTFFARLPPDGGTGAAVLYYLVIGMLVAGANLFWEAVGDAAGVGDDVIAELGAGISPLVTFLLTPLILMVALGIAAGVCHLVLLMVRGARHRIDTTVRVFCYAYSPMVLGIVPVLGTILGTIWMVVLAVIGLKEAHRTETWKGAVAVVGPFLVLMGMAAFAVMTLLAGAALLT